MSWSDHKQTKMLTENWKSFLRESEFLEEGLTPEEWYEKLRQRVEYYKKNKPPTDTGSQYELKIALQQMKNLKDKHPEINFDAASGAWLAANKARQAREDAATKADLDREYANLHAAQKARLKDEEARRKEEKRLGIEWLLKNQWATETPPSDKEETPPSDEADKKETPPSDEEEKLPWFLQPIADP